MAGPYKIFSKVGNLYKVELLDLVKIYPIFLLDKLQKAAINFLLRQINPPPLLVQINSKDKQEIKEILAYKLIKKNAKVLYKLKGI